MDILGFMRPSMCMLRVIACYGTRCWAESQELVQINDLLRSVTKSKNWFTLPTNQSVLCISLGGTHIGVVKKSHLKCGGWLAGTCRWSCYIWQFGYQLNWMLRRKTLWVWLLYGLFREDSMTNVCFYINMPLNMPHIHSVRAVVANLRKTINPTLLPRKRIYEYQWELKAEFEQHSWPTWSLFFFS